MNIKDFVPPLYWQRTASIAGLAHGNVIFFVTAILVGFYSGGAQLAEVYAAVSLLMCIPISIGMIIKSGPYISKTTATPASLIGNYLASLFFGLLPIIMWVWILVGWLFGEVKLPWLSRK